jgi:hypothetical protein
MLNQIGAPQDEYVDGKGKADETSRKRNTMWVAKQVILVGRCRLTGSEPVLKAPMVLALATIIS